MDENQIRIADIVPVAENKYPCPNSLLRTKAVTQAKIDAFVEGAKWALSTMAKKEKTAEKDSYAPYYNYGRYV